ncbi:hypothetical protein Godav_013609 [Gossypium davidsonii]|uniref:Uncharacterized protein n=2 Tax=Gossypium TaxID=3633 RepID=A0A7J8RHS3_GOSDV|nr:hypothetical protein [Gossypium davidsonii]MBA0648303.1 hypothetical protein [Gossypium klotzschianum]
MVLTNENKSMDEISVVLRRFGDEQSTLLDQFERLSFEVQLNQAILSRSLSEPSVAKRSQYCSQFQAPPPAVKPKGRKGRRGSGFNRVLKKLLKPILGRKGNAGKKPVADPQNPMSCKAFSRSLRL